MTWVAASKMGLAQILLPKVSARSGSVMGGFFVCVSCLTCVGYSIAGQQLKRGDDDEKRNQKRK